MSPNTKRHIKSFLITFVSTFALAIVPLIGDLSFTKSGLIAFVVALGRAGLKVFLERIAQVNTDFITEQENA